MPCWYTQYQGLSPARKTGVRAGYLGCCNGTLIEAEACRSQVPTRSRMLKPPLQIFFDCPSTAWAQFE